MNFLMVMIGGGVGACIRYALSLITVKTDFPLMTFITNFFGAFFIGIIVGITDIKGMNKNLNLFLKTGFCGGFTTFSTFSLESITLIEKGNIPMGIVYIVSSVVICLLGVIIGKLIIKKLA